MTFRFLKADVYLGFTGSLSCGRQTEAAVSPLPMTV